MIKILILNLLFTTFLFSNDGDNNSGKEEIDEKTFTGITKYKNFSLMDYNGVKHSLEDYKNAEAIVLMFISTQCPVSNSYNSHMAKIHKNYSVSNIVFLGINSNKQESVEEIKSHSAEKGFHFPVLKDWNNKIADMFEASVTPEIYVINNNFELQYHGRIDDSSEIEDVEESDLAITLNEIISGKEVSVKETKAFGCSIKRVEN